MYLAERARAVLSENLRWADLNGKTMPYVVPQKEIYDAAWLWDTGWIAAATARYNPDLATDLVGFHILTQKKYGRFVGMLPHMVFLDDDTHLPGPLYWGTENDPIKTSMITQPANLARALEAALKHGGDRDKIAGLLPALGDFHQYLLNDLDPMGWGAVAANCSWVSADNIPAFDGPKSRIPSKSPLRREEYGLTQEEHKGGHPTMYEWGQYATLINAIREGDYSHFLVYCPFLTYMAAKDALALSRSARELGMSGLASQSDQRVTKYLDGLEKLWQEKEGYYGYYDYIAGRFIPTEEAGESFASYSPAWLPEGLIPRKRQKKLLKTLNSPRFSTKYGITTVPRIDKENNPNPFYKPLGYWSGPIWSVPLNEYLDYLRFNRKGESKEAQRVSRQLTDLLSINSYEYYNPELDPKIHPGITPGFSWTAAHALEAIAEKGVKIIPAGNLPMAA